MRRRIDASNPLNGILAPDHGFPLKKSFNGAPFRLHSVHLGGCRNSLEETTKTCHCGTKKAAQQEAERLRKHLNTNVRTVHRANQKNQPAGTAIYVQLI